MAQAVDRLASAAAASGAGSQDNSDWESVVAAAAVVAASTQSNKERKHVQFGQDDHVLVLLTLLNITNRTDDATLFTIDPVNCYGYPFGEGKTDAERQGPHSFVLCTVKKVHFDEDERYYTVRRADTGAEQRADPQWMEAIRGGHEGKEAAWRAAKRSKQTQEVIPKTEHHGFHLFDFMSCPVMLVRNKLIPFYKSSRSSAKVLLENILWGREGYGCRFRVSCVNFFVLCSFIYMFIEPFTIAFLPASLDFASAVVEM
jgi:hypothetical protein